MLGAAGNVEFYHSVIFQGFKRFEYIIYIKTSGGLLPLTCNQADVNYISVELRCTRIEFLNTFAASYLNTQQH